MWPIPTPCHRYNQCRWRPGMSMSHVVMAYEPNVGLDERYMDWIGYMWLSIYNPMSITSYGLDINENDWKILKAEHRNAERWWVLAARMKSASLGQLDGHIGVDQLIHIFLGVWQGSSYVPPIMPQTWYKTWIAMFKQVKINRCTLVEICRNYCIVLSLLHPVSICLYCFQASKWLTKSVIPLYPAEEQ